VKEMDFSADIKLRRAYMPTQLTSPMALLSMIAAVLTLQAIAGYAIATAAVLWCALSSSKLFSIALSMEGQKLLVAYPCALLYAVFALLAIF